VSVTLAVAAQDGYQCWPAASFGQHADTVRRLGSPDVVTIGCMAAVAGSERLLERDVELARLTALLAQAQAGSGAVAAIEGPAGIGKTALLEALRRQAADRGIRSLRARGLACWRPEWPSR
jgi:hypothetical protein